jgi:N-acetylglucosamine-6-phosphate deacetylase
VVSAARILLEGLAGDPSALLLEGECVAAVGAAALAAAGTAARVDAAGLRAVPGFIELQVNGVDGHDFTSDPAAIRSAGVGLARHGVTAFLATIVSSPRGTPSSPWPPPWSAGGRSTSPRG